MSQNYSFPPMQQSSPMPPPNRLAQGSSRTGLWLALGCLALALILGVLGLGGGAAYFLLRDDQGGSGAVGQEEPEEDPGESPEEDPGESPEEDPGESPEEDPGQSPEEDPGESPEEDPGQSPEEEPVGDGGTIDHDLFSLTYPAGFTDTSDDEDFTSLGGEVRLTDTQTVGSLPRREVKIYHFSNGADAKTECEVALIWAGPLWDSVDQKSEVDTGTLGGREGSTIMVIGTYQGEPAMSTMYCTDVDGKVVQVAIEAFGENVDQDPDLLGILESWSWKI
ncbi:MULTISPECIES: hypothetical protein [unclassified Brachybacterium]|uniref:hypothetical protein n=1 Tax=unclassified Brachybacterium TaxID=2623841 RepID=UPI000C808178|nr:MULTISPECIES: hypothetical protein [unclassified Brachybacterium]PMC75619.1 hypothetical protein CJ197_07730 [Brachybacterium sp. UMB0905]